MLKFSLFFSKTASALQKSKRLKDMQNCVEIQTVSNYLDINVF